MTDNLPQVEMNTVCCYRCYPTTRDREAYLNSVIRPDDLSSLSQFAALEAHFAIHHPESAQRFLVCAFEAGVEAQPGKVHAQEMYGPADVKQVYREVLERRGQGGGCEFGVAVGYQLNGDTTPCGEEPFDVMLLIWTPDNEPEGVPQNIGALLCKTHLTETREAMKTIEQCDDPTHNHDHL